jgi:hypothetical protein
MGSAVAAGALTGAGIAALSGDDILGGAFTGGLGGMSGGSMGAAAAKTAEAAKLAQAGAPTGSINTALYGTSANISPFTPSGVAGSQTASSALGGAGLPAMQQGAGQVYTGSLSGMTPGADLTGAQTVASGGGYNPSAFGRGVESAQAALREPGTFLENLGDGSKAMGAGKLGLSAAGIAGQAGAFDQEPVNIGPREEERYDPNRRLNLNMDTGISKYLGDRDTGLRLLAQGGQVQKFNIGGLYGITPAAPPPVYGKIDVGGKFVETSKEAGPGLISDVEYKEQYLPKDGQQTQKQEGSSAFEGMDGSADDKSKASAGAISALAQGFARQQTSSPNESVRLGLESLAGGGYLETGGKVGDGMSDEIKASIDGNQEARLSDGEFVVPADVVSHLGNGSSDAGAKRLYEMMDKVRTARTGTKKQGKEITPERYMPR